MNEAREPHPFLPPWRVKIGPLQQTGRGLLEQPLGSQRELVDSFMVFLGDVTVDINPPSGQIHFGTQLMYQGELGKRHRLVWNRRMEKAFGTRDPNTATFRCLWYGVGLEHDGGRHGYRLFEDGRLVEGL